MRAGWYTQLTFIPVRVCSKPPERIPLGHDSHDSIKENNIWNGEHLQVYHIGPDGMIDAIIRLQVMWKNTSVITPGQLISLALTQTTQLPISISHVIVSRCTDSYHLYSQWSPYMYSSVCAWPAVPPQMLAWHEIQPQTRHHFHHSYLWYSTCHMLNLRLMKL